MAMMPMFPLGSVLLPGGVLPLHVFEPRYRALVRDCLTGPEPEFGVTMIVRGQEVGGGDERAEAGTVARILQADEIEPGRLAVLTVGTRRIRVNAWLPDDPYPMADVEDWPDEQTSIADGFDGELVDQVRSATGRVATTAALAADLGFPPADVEEISSDPLVASYQLCSLAPIGAADAYRLLCADGPRERLTLLDAALDDVEAMLRFRLQP